MTAFDEKCKKRPYANDPRQGWALYLSTNEEEKHDPAALIARNLCVLRKIAH